ncbi:MAG: UDP-N-acetylmuramoyl-tripeptide--D-alanyl-D-alanine ligase [Candidatus Cyclobacteriaceae bacterium M2_1C_046]
MDINFLYNEFKASSGISTDTRNILSNQIFFALRGPNFNANTLAGEALKKGARLAVVDDPAFATSSKAYLVKDSLLSLQELAIYHRDQLDIPVFSLTGSNGKTTTKELLKVVLEQKYNVIATKGNLNNHIGVPLTILAIQDHEIAIIEMGANHVGEIVALCRIAKPTHGLITNIGKAHIGEFGGFENIIRGKSELYDFLLKNNGQVFINTQDEVLKNMAKRFKNPVLYPDGENSCNIKLLDADPLVKMQLDNGKQINSNLIGAYNFPNFAAAICVGSFFDVPLEDAVRAIESYTPANNRSQVVKLGSNTVILDAYNANPTSMEAAVRSFGQMKASDKIVILGDMLELGDTTKAEHFKLGDLVNEQSFKQVYFVGPLMMDAYAAYPRSTYFETKKELISFFEKHPPEHSHILLKGSRGMGLEALVEVFKER